MYAETKKKWYVFYCRSRSEKKLLQNLKEENYEILVPLIEEIHLWSDRHKKVKVPLIRGYVFIYCRIKDFSEIIEKQHIVAPVKNAGEFAFLRQTDIDFLRIIDELGLNATAQPLYLTKGDKVDIISGPFKGHSGTFVNERSKHYVVLELQPINYQVKITVLKKDVKGEKIKKSFD
jgi:transcription antitermination factor NusG